MARRDDDGVSMSTCIDCIGIAIQDSEYVVGFAPPPERFGMHSHSQTEWISDHFGDSLRLNLHFGL